MLAVHSSDLSFLGLLAGINQDGIASIASTKKISVVL